MIDENYHIEDFDEGINLENEYIGEIKRKEKPVFKSKIIYENSKTSENDTYDDYRQFDYGEHYKNEYESEDDKSYSDFKFDENKSNKSSSNSNSFFNRFMENYIIKSYRNNPNTFKGTIIGIIISILILSIGFLKALLITTIVLISNIIGQFFDQNPRLISFVDLVVKRFR